MWRAWVAVVLWAVLILRLSGDDLSAAQTSRILGPLLAWLFPDLDAGTRQLAHFLVRKGAHFVEYAVLGTLAAWALWRTRRTRRLLQVAGALAVVLGVAFLDEGRQARSTERTGSLRDVGLDGAGGLAGAGSFVLLASRRRTRSGPP